MNSDQLRTLETAISTWAEEHLDQETLRLSIVITSGQVDMQIAPGQEQLAAAYLTVEQFEAAGISPKTYRKRILTFAKSNLKLNLQTATMRQFVQACTDRNGAFVQEKQFGRTSLQMLNKLLLHQGHIDAKLQYK